MSALGMFFFGALEQRRKENCSFESRYFSQLYDEEQ
jgi:hypothetical protein